MTATDPAPLDQSTSQEVEQFLSEWAGDEAVPGVSLAVTDRARSCWSVGIGSRDLDSNEPATPDTVYGLGSITKSVTAFAVLELVAEDRIGLDEPVTGLLDVSLPNGATPTIHELLTHTSGIPSMGTSSVLIARRAGIGEAGIPMADSEDFYRHLAGASDDIDPSRDRFQYCNAGYTLLADLVTELRDAPFPEVVASSLFEPLGMERATFSAATFDAMSDAITPYRRSADDELQPTALPVRELSWGPGGLLASVRAMCPYLRLQLGAGTVDGTTLLPETLVHAAHEGHVDTPVGPYGYGWRRRTVGDVSVIGHGGSIAVSTAYAGFLPDHELGFCVAANTSPGYSLSRLGEAIALALVGEDPREAPYFLRQRRLDRLTGTYETYRGIRTAEVEERGGVVEITFTDAFGDMSQVLVPEEPDLDTGRFIRHGDGGERRPVQFCVGTDGEIDLLIDRWRLHKQ